MVKNILLSLLGLAVIWFFAVSLPFTIADWDSRLFPFPMGVVSLIGWVPMILGSYVILWCYGLFILVGKGTPWPFDPPKKLVVAGPYRFVRNPMEGSFFVIVLGEAFLFQSVLLILYTLVGFSLFHLQKVFIEEPALQARFGESYDRYHKSVPRWIPRLSPYMESA